MSAVEKRDESASHKTYDLRLTVDDSALRTALLELKGYLSGQPIEFPHGLSQLVSIDVDGGTATRTGELRITLKPSNALMEYISAARIGTGNV